MSYLVDTHCHLIFEDFKEDLESVINNAFNYVKTKHNSITEKYSYKSLLD